MTINKAIGLVVSDYLLNNKMTRKQLIEKSGVSRTNLFQIIKGEISPTADTLMLLADGMDLTIVEFIDRAYRLMNQKKPN